MAPPVRTILGQYTGSVLVRALRKRTHINTATPATLHTASKRRTTRTIRSHTRSAPYCQMHHFSAFGDMPGKRVRLDTALSFR